MDLVVVTGPRGCGKTTLAHELATQNFPKALVLDEHRFGAAPGDRDLIGRYVEVATFIDLEICAACKLRYRKVPVVVCAHDGLEAKLRILHAYLPAHRFTLIDFEVSDIVARATPTLMRLGYKLMAA